MSLKAQTPAPESGASWKCPHGVRHDCGLRLCLHRPDAPELEQLVWMPGPAHGRALSLLRSRGHPGLDHREDA